MSKVNAKRVETINLRALAYQKELLDRAAAIMGKSRSDFMLEASCAQAEKVLLDQVLFSLEDDEFESFTQLLEKPLSENDKVQALLASPSPWEK
ncbi:MAG: DUF1778 domain-containing protein [Pelistega sp.]|nr:DUF1778 domain-containing protein [Pelistega sp.]